MSALREEKKKLTKRTKQKAEGKQSANMFDDIFLDKSTPTKVSEKIDEIQEKANLIKEEEEKKEEEIKKRVKEDALSRGLERIRPDSSKKEVKYKIDIFDFLEEPENIERWQKYALLSITRVNPEKKATYLTKRALFEKVKEEWTEQDLGDVNEKTLTKWMLKRGYATEEQIRNYYRSRSRERQNKVKRGVMLDELVSDLLESEVQMERLLKNSYFREGVANIVRDSFMKNK